MEGKYNLKRDADQTKIHASSKAAPSNSDSDASPKIPRKKKAMNGVRTARNNQGKKPPNNKGYQYYYVLYNKAGMPDHKYNFA